MKRHFLTGLKAFAVSALALAAVSCYDDSELWGELEGLEQRVAALEEKLNSEVATLNSKIGAVETAYKAADADLLKKLTDLDAKLVSEIAKLVGDLDAADGILDGLVTTDDLAAEIKKLTDAANAKYAELAGVDKEILAALTKVAVTKVEKNAAGNAVLTFLDGTTLEVGAADANANNTGLVTVVDGKWAVIGADGKTTVLDAEVHPDTELKFKVDSDTNELLVSYDGKTWEQTGVIVNDDTTINVVTDVEYTEGDDFVTIIVGENEYVLPFYSADDSSLVLGRTDVFFMYGATKAIELDSEAVTECYVMSKPDGWKAVLKDGLITITAPSEDLLSIGAGETEGQVLVHATTNNGICKVVSINVTTGPAVRFEYIDGNIHVFNALYYTYMFMGMYEETEFYDLYFGMTTADVFMGYDSFDEYLQDNYENDIMSTFREYARYCGDDETYYVAGEREEQNLTIPLSKILEYDEREMDEDDTYIFWVLPTKEREPFFEYAQCAFEGVYATMASSNHTFNNVDLSFDILGSNACYIGAVNKLDVTYYEEIGEEESFKLYLQNGPHGFGGPLMDFMYGTPDAMGELYDMTEFGSLNLSDVVLPSSGEKVVDAGSNYYVWVMPYVEGKDTKEYTVNDILVFSTSTGDMVYSATVMATVGTIDCDYFSVSVEFTPPANAKTYYKLYETQTLNENYSDGESYLTEYIVDDLLADRYYTEEAFTFEETYEINPSTEYTLVLYSTTNDGQCGDLQFVSCPTKSYEVLEDVVELKSFTLDESGNNYVATFTISDNRVTKIAGYNRTNAPDDFMQEYYLGQVKKSLLKGTTYSSAQYAEVVNGEATLTFKKVETMKDYFVYACVIEDEVVTALTDEAYLFNIEDALTSEE